MGLVVQPGSGRERQRFVCAGVGWIKASTPGTRCDSTQRLFQAHASQRMNAKDREPYVEYLRQVTDKPVRVSILVANNFVEEMIESVIAEAVPNSECFKVSKMPFERKRDVIRALDASITESAVWPLIDKLNKLRAAALTKTTKHCAKSDLRNSKRRFCPLTRTLSCPTR
jgi:hypothetical protein